ncbi:unnamed protein product [Bubo scandiacus]
MGQANGCCGSRDALADAEPVLSADVQLTRGCKRSERRLLLLQEELVVTKLRTPDGAKKPRVTLVPSLKLLEKELSRRHAAGSGCSRALFGQPLAALCGEDGTLPRPIQELLAVLQQEGPSTEGIFRRAAGGTELRELREALDCGADVDLGSQPALLLAAILKDFLRSIPCKLLVTDLYEDWMAAMQKASREEKIWELRAVAEKLPAANLLLLKRLLSLLQHIGHHAATSRMGCSNLAVCVGPNLLSPAHADLLPLEAMLEVTHKVPTAAKLDALADAEPVLSADVQLTRGCKRSERRLLLLQEELVVTKLRTPDGAKKPRVTLVPSLKLLEKELSRRHAAGSGCSRALFGQPLAALCGEDGTLPRPIQELLAVLQQEGPSTEGIFRRAAGGTELRELREALDCGADVDLGSQPALLLAAILKDFLRSIPCKLLVTDLYEDWMAAMQKASREEKIWELRAVAEKLPAANLLLLKRLLSLLQHIGHHAATSRMGCSNLAVCVGPNLLSPAHADLLPLEAMLEVTHKVNVLVEFLVENCRELFEEEAGSLSSPADKELPAPLERFRDLSLEEKSVPAGKVDTEHRAEAFPHAPPSLLGVLTEAGGDTAVESETGEAPPALPPATPESMADSLGRPEELARFPEERRDALADAEPVLSADVQLTRGCKRSERRLLLLQEELVVTKLRSQALKELWVHTLLGTPDGAKKPRVTLVPSLKLLEKELSRRHAWKPFSTRSLERLVEGQAEAGSGCSRALFGQPLAALCGEDGTLPRPIQELLAVLQQEGPSTEGIFRRAAGGTELRELREALDCGADVDLGSQPALLLAAILKDFLRSIPCKLLVTDLYEDWMAAMQKASREEKIWELRAVAEKLPAANLLLLKRLLSLLQHIGHHAATSRMGCSNLAVCVGPNLLSPAHADLLPLEAMLEVTHKVPTAAKLDALADAEPVLSADVQLTRGCKRSERRLLLLQEELVVTKLRSQALKELWVHTLLGTPDGAKKPRVTLVPSLKLLEKELSRRHAWKPFSTRSLERLVEGQAEELLAVLQQEGPSTEGIFRRAAGGTELRELREALDCGADVDLGSQPALLLAAILKVSASALRLEELLAGPECSNAHLEPGALQDFLRSIPCKLLVTDLYEDWMAAMQKASREEKIWELRAVAEKLPAANLLLLKRLLSLLQHIGHHAATSRMGCSNLAVCVGPNLLSPAHADLLPLEAMLEVTHKVNVLVEFLVENCRELFEEEAGSLSSPADKELPAPLERFRVVELGLQEEG